MRLIFSLSFALSFVFLPGAAAAANWVKYTQTTEAQRYFDKERTIAMGGTAFIWDLHDLQAESQSGNGQPYRSVLYAVEVNCRKEQRRILSFHRMSGTMGAGSVVDEHSMVSEWSAPDAQTPDARLMAIACEIK